MKTSSYRLDRFLKKFKLFDKETFAKERKKNESHVANMYTDSSSQSYKHMICVLTTLTADKDIINLCELTSLKQTKKSNDWLKWKTMMKTKLVLLQENEIWSLVKSSTNQKILTGKWVFKIKKDYFSDMLKYKTWWIVHSYKQMKDLDYIETFVTVIKLQI